LILNFFLRDDLLGAKNFFNCSDGCVFVFTTNADLSAAATRPLGFTQERPAPQAEDETEGEKPREEE